jgi:uncharacterized repeat protein (TIGR01451 family)
VATADGSTGDGAGESITVRRTRRWRGAVAVVLLSVAVGVIAKRPSVLLLGAVGVAFAAYPHLTGPPAVELSVTRRLDPESPSAGETVDVTTTVRNDGDDPLFDLRLIDGVPPMATVESGSPRCGTALRPGEEATVEYAIEVDRTTHRFRPVLAIARDASGAIEVETTVAEETVVQGVGRVPEVPLRTRSRRRSGRLLTDEAGSGVEFHRTREYEPGDPAGRIDWRQYARTGELTAIDFREERLAEVVVCVDARPAAYRARSPGEPHAVAYAVGSAGRVGEALFAADHRVGLAALGRDRCWLRPGAGNDHEDRYHRRLATDAAFDAALPTDGATAGPSLLRRLVGADESPVAAEPSVDSQLATIRAQLGADTQLLFLTPLGDDDASWIAQVLERSGAAVTVLSADVTSDDTAGGRLARIERDNRIHALRNSGIPVVEWDPDERLGTAMALAGGRP